MIEVVVLVVDLDSIHLNTLHCYLLQFSHKQDQHK